MNETRDDDISTMSRDLKVAAMAFSATEPGASEQASVQNWEDAPEPLAPTSIGKFQVQGLVGQGAMGTVYAAYDHDLERKVAIKLLRGRSSRHLEGQRRMRREAQALARLSHPNVVHVYEVGELRGETYIAMEFIEGETIRAWLQRRPTGWREVLTAYIAAGEGLCAAHDAGLVHRDFKPDNVLIGADGRVKVVDFGLVRLDEQTEADAQQPPTFPAYGHNTTQVGAIIGTPAYMSPEQYAGGRADARSDQFSFCVALHEALYAERPPRLNDPAAASRESNGPPRAKRGRKSPPQRVYRALKQGLSLRPDERHASMRALLRILHRSARGLAIWTWAAAIGLALAVGGGFLWLAVKDSDELCTRGLVELAEAWGDERRLALRDAFAASTLPYAPTILARILPQLDDYAGTWNSAYTISCLEHQNGESSAGQLDQRMGCLRIRREQLRALVDVLIDGSTRAIENASHAVAALTPVEQCTAPTSTPVQKRAPPEQIAAEIHVLDLDLARVKAEYDAGLYESALSQSTRVVDRTRALQYEPSLAEALAYHGLILFQSGKFAEAEKTLLEAEVLADSHGEDRLRAEILTNMVILLGERQGRPAEGLQAAKRARSALRRFGGDRPTEAWLLIAEGTVLRCQGDYTAARLNLEQALELAASEPDDSNRVLALNELGNIAQVLQDYPNAARHFEEAIDLTRREMGDEHPKLIYFKHNLSNVYRDDGRPDAAEHALADALRIAEASLGSQHPIFATLLDSLGLVRIDRGDLLGATPLFERARQILEASLGPVHPSLMPVMLDLVDVHTRLDAIDEAMTYTERAIAIWEANKRDVTLDILLAQLIVKLMPKLPAAKIEWARSHLDIAVTIARARKSVPDQISSLAAIARLEHNAGRSILAQERLKEATEINQTTSPNVDPIDLGRARLALAEALWTNGERERGLALADSITLPDAGAEEVQASLTAWLHTARTSDGVAP